jgi:hypothetical protein
LAKCAGFLRRHEVVRARGGHVTQHRTEVAGSVGAVRFSATRTDSLAITKYRVPGGAPLTVKEISTAGASWLTRDQFDSGSVPLPNVASI